MSKLQNAPLVEVIFELRWNTIKEEELAKYQYLHGDMYAQIKEEYKFREALYPPDVPIELYLNKPAHRFRVAPKGYPLIQVGPGLLTVNTIDPNYIWEDYERQIIDVTKNFLQVYKLKDNQEITLVLQYFDFLQFSFEKNDVHDFLSKNLNISVKQNFYKNTNNPNNLNLGFHYHTDLGSLALGLSRGKDTNRTDGIVIRTNLASKSIKPEITLIQEWLNKSHEFCSQLFKDMTHGDLYDSFSQTKIK